MKLNILPCFSSFDVTNIKIQMNAVERFFYGGKYVTRFKIIHKTNLIEMVSLFLYAKKAGSVAN